MEFIRGIIQVPRPDTLPKQTHQMRRASKGDEELGAIPIAAIIRHGQHKGRVECMVESLVFERAPGVSLGGAGVDGLTTRAVARGDVTALQGERIVDAKMKTCQEQEFTQGTPLQHLKHARLVVIRAMLK